MLSHRENWFSVNEHEIYLACRHDPKEGKQFDVVFCLRLKPGLDADAATLPFRPVCLRG